MDCVKTDRSLEMHLCPRHPPEAVSGQLSASSQPCLPHALGYKATTPSSRFLRAPPALPQKLLPPPQRPERCVAREHAGAPRRAPHAEHEGRRRAQLAALSRGEDGRPPSLPWGRLAAGLLVSLHKYIKKKKGETSGPGPGGGKIVTGRPSDGGDEGAFPHRCPA